MHARSKSLSRISGLIGLALSAVAASAHADPRQVYVLTADQRIARVLESQPGVAGGAPAVTGIEAGQTLVAIDLRPQNGALYGLGFNNGTGAMQLYHIAWEPTAARAIAVGGAGSSGTFSNAGGTPVPVSGTGFGMDFNPAVDRLRVVTNTGQNFRMNPNTGAFIDGDLGGAPGSVSFLNMDGPINAGTVTLDEAAYTNSRINTTVTTLYTLDAFTNALFIQTPPNAGTQTSAIPITLAGNPLDFSSESGFDIPRDVLVTGSNLPVASGSGLAALTVGGISSLYRIDLTNGNAILIGSFGTAVRDITITSEEGAANVLSNSGTSITRFNALNTATATTQAITGVAGGETLVGFDGRPATGQLYALGINPAANTATLYLLDPQTGASTAIGTPGQIAFVDGLGVPIDLPDPATQGYGIDFNPMVDRIRVVAGSGVNFRLNPITGAPLDSDTTTAGTQPDGAINGAVSVALAGAAYTNNIGGAAVTTLYTLDAGGNRLFIQVPPNNGTQTNALAVTLDGAPLDFNSVSSFDIPPGVNVATPNTPASGQGYAVLTVGAVTSLYSIDLASGVATNFGGTTGGAAGFVMWNAPPLFIFADSFE